MATKCSFIRAAVSGSSNDSRSITWHQWHAAYPTDSRMRRSSLRARSRASAPHGYQSTGLWACWRRYGLVSPARRLAARSSACAPGVPDSLIPTVSRTRRARPTRAPAVCDFPGWPASGDLGRTAPGSAEKCPWADDPGGRARVPCIREAGLHRIGGPARLAVADGGVRMTAVQVVLDQGSFWALIALA